MSLKASTSLFVTVVTTRFSVFSTAHTLDGRLLRVQLMRQGKDLSSDLQHRCACTGEVATVNTAYQQLGADALFKQTHLSAQVGLRYAQTLRGAIDASGVGNFHEAPETFNCDRAPCGHGSISDN